MDLIGKQVIIVDVHKEDARFRLKDKMIGEVVTIIDGKIRDGWFSGTTKMHVLQVMQMLDITDPSGWSNNRFLNHYKIKIEEV